MKQKPKPCKGIQPTTKGLGCGKPTYYRTYGLGRDCGCYQDWLLNTEAGKLKMKKAELKATKPRRELEKAEREHKERMRLPKALEITQEVFNRYIRLRDVGLPCISEGIAWKNDFDAGHFFSVKQYSELRFDFDNCHGQSIQGNRMKDGNFQDYAINLPYRIGEERFAELLKRAERSKQRVKKWTLEELEEIRTECKRRIKELQNGA
ncbi:recombination protein NinG [Muricauda sp. CAU 1633]|uniref:recombination protein NinG n=1 Tax=Allomuricauda sp. CAU 1633 TaxID=2816036 RepID=UPI001A8F1F76|nr:recombination protein NinG [Muricauda sp. CAU 1633]MBO0323504.1 recombination protein NinG [Muricauda sp. CAU 1633]